MAAFMIFFRDGEVVDPEAMAAYQLMNRDTPAAHYGLEPLVVYGQMETLEGEAPDGVVVLKFPRVEDAKAWYYSPGYQAALAHRMRAAHYRVVLVEGI
jgi:uncharacterized protein (DUF1330 family)